MTRSVGLLIAVVSSLSACSREASDSLPASTNRVDERRVVHSTEPEWATGEAWSVSPSPDVLAPAEPEGPGAIIRVGEADVLPDGRLAVADVGRDEILIFDREGQLLEVLGGRGEGPGEFVSLSKIRVEGDSVVAAETNITRVTWFGSDGKLRSTRQTGFVRPNGEGWWPLPGWGALVREVSRGSANPSPGAERVTRHLSVLHSDGTRDTLTSFLGLEIVTVDAGGPMLSRFGALLGPDSYIAVGGDDTSWRVVLGDGAEPRLTVWDQNLAPLLDISWDPDVAELAESDLSAIKASWVQAQIDFGGEDPAESERRVNLLPEPTRFPVFDAILVADDGSIWVRRADTTDRHTLWYVFSDAGVWLGEVEVPRDVDRVVAISDGQLVGVRRDALGVESIAVHRVRYAPDD